MRKLYILGLIKSDMKKRVMTLVVLLLLLPFSLARDDLYSMDSLQLQLHVDGSFDLAPAKNTATLKEVSAEVLYYPQEDYRQKILDWNSAGIVKNNDVTFSWKDGKIEPKLFGYDASLETTNQHLKVQEKISFPLQPEDIAGLEEYLQPTETIDSNNPAVIAKAAQLAEGEDDLFKVAFKLASWVEENVKYDLNTVTVSASQKASWVLQNKDGVCDEMSSLFVAMARSLGIPARFVSGISYTNSQDVVNVAGSNWAGHGWAELYFPGRGWVSFDVTFNQYGYIDVTHIKLRDGFDPTDPAVKYEWISDGVDLKKGKLNLKVEVQKEGAIVSEQIQLKQEILAHEVGFGSYNLVKGVIKNNADYYTATALNLATPKEIEVIGRNRRNILLRPKEVRETFWIIKVPDNLKTQYTYTFPVKIYSEKNISVEDMFTAQEGKNSYSKQEIEELTVQDEEKSYSQKISFDCQYQKEIRPGEEMQVSCSVKNIGNTNLNNLQFCLNRECQTFDLLINQQKNAEIQVSGDQVGWQKVIISAKNDLVEKKASLEYAVIDEPKVALAAQYPETVTFGEPLNIETSLKKDSFTEPQNLALTISGAGTKSVWDLHGLGKEENINYTIDGEKLSWNNNFIMTATWEDREGKSYSAQEKITIKAKGDSLTDKVKMFWNWMIDLFYLTEAINFSLN